MFGLELSALVAVALTIWRARLRPAAMAANHDARTLFAYSLLLGLIQLSLMVWTARQGCAWALLPALAVVGESFIDDRILRLEDCIGGDQFMCLPDRWPWQVEW